MSFKTTTLYLIVSAIFFFVSQKTFSQSNLSSFEVITNDGSVFKGYAEPKNPLTDENSAVKSRIYIFPQVELDENSLIVRNKFGDKVNVNNYSQFEELTARINIELKPNKPSEEELLIIIHKINSGIRKPISLQDKPIQPTNNGVGDYNQKMAVFNNKMFEWESSREQALNYLKGYQVVPVNPRNLEFRVIVNGVNIKDHQLTTNSTVGSGVFQINIPFSNDPFNFRLLLEQDYLIQSDFQYLSSKFQSASAIKDLKTFVYYSAEQFRKEIVSAQTSSSGFLFWKSTRRSIKRYVEEQSKQNLSSGTVSRYEYTVYDGDEHLMKQVDNFLFPEISLTETINSHLNAAQKAIEKGDDQMSKIHSDYAQFLKDGATSLADLNHIDALGALTSLSQGNIAAFLAQGVAFNQSNSTGTFTFRRIISGTLTQTDTKEFNALIFKSLFENHLFTTKPKNKLDSNKNLLPQDVESNFILVEGGKFKFGQSVDFPTTSTTTPFGFNFSNDSYTNDELTEISDFWIGKWEVTQKEWEDIMNYNNSEYKGNNLPVTNMTWIEAALFCNKLSEKYNLEPVYSIILEEVKIKKDANGFRLPTAQQWEYAAKGGLKSKGYYYSGSNNVDEVAWFQNNTTDQTQNVGRKKPNELGIYDMSGNVIEWCFTSKSDLPLQTGEIHVANSPLRKITKGGSYRTYESRLTPWSGSFYFYNQKYKWIGFRVLLPNQ